jgi:hypothetical protein
LVFGEAWLGRSQKNQIYPSFGKIQKPHTQQQMEKKGSTDDRALRRGKSCVIAFELYNTQNGKNEFYDW